LRRTAASRPDLVRGGVFRDPKIAFAVGVALLARLIRFIVLKKAVLRSDEVVIRLGQQIRVGNEKTPIATATFDPGLRHEIPVAMPTFR
jgi:hypothetical protein